MGAKAKIGLEIHGYLDIPSSAKLFCDCALDPAEPNTNICPVCTGQPGSKPKLPNKEAIDAILKIALFLNCKLNPELLWQRKHYSWPDLPNGYQKTMSGAYSQPVGLHGEFLGIGIEEVHLEEDPARWDPVTGGVDYNRSGFPLVEIVTKPDFKSSGEVREWLENLMVALRYIKAVRPDLGVKCDVNVSIAPAFIRTEVKNVNSFTAITQAIEFEIKRQAKEPIKQQTRAWDEQTQSTLFMRDKEHSQDYRFIPDPDLPVISITDAITQPLKEGLPERPDQKQAKFEKAGVPKDVSQKLSANLVFAVLAEQDMAKLHNIPAEFIANRYNNELKGVLTIESKTAEALEATDAKTRQALIDAFHSRTITNIAFKELTSDLLAHENKTVKDAIAKFKAGALSTDDIDELVQAAIAANPAAAADVRQGKDKAINAIAGHVIKALKAKGKAADPKAIQERIKEAL